MQVAINSYTQGNNIVDGDKGDITVSSQGTIWTINNQQLSNRFVYGEIPLGDINGVNATFTSTNPFIPESLQVYLNGLKQSNTNDYIVTGNNTFTFFISPQQLDLPSINYIKQ